MKYNTPLTTSCEDGELIIRIGVNTLAHAIAHGSLFHTFDDVLATYIRNFAITDAEQFARDILRELNREEENGETSLIKLFDQAAQAAIDDGSVAIEYDQQIEFEKKSPLEKW